MDKIKIKKTKRVSPVADVEIFSYNPDSRDVLASNFLENTEKLQKYALATFGDLGKIIKDKEYPRIERIVINPLDEEYEGMTANRLNKLQSTLDVEWIKRKEKVRENKTKLFGFMMQLLSEEGEERIRNNIEQWDTIESECDPLGLWKAIIVTHGMRTDDLSELESKRSARIGYQRCHQIRDESLLSFTNRFRQCINILRAVNEVIPDDATLAVDYLEAVDKRLYGDMLRDLKNRVRNGETEFPADVSSAHSYVRNYIPPFSRRSESTASSKTVYFVSENESKTEDAAPAEPKTKRKCSECGRLHYGVCWGPKMERSPYSNNKSVNVHDMIIDEDDSNNKDAYYYSNNSSLRKNKGASQNDYIDINNIVLRCDNKEMMMGSNKIVCLDSCSNTCH